MIGIHIDSSKNNIINSINDAKNNGANLVQFFVSTNLKSKDIYDDVKNLLIELKMDCIVHASYTINLSKNWNEYSSWITQFISEIKLAYYIGAKYIVVHLGKQLNLSRAESINNLYTSIIYICNRVKKLEIKILIETSTGQGTEIGYGLEELALIYNKFSKHPNKNISDRIKICLDTCHIYAAGYDITDKKIKKSFLTNFDYLIGLDNIKLIHLNDCKSKFNSHTDRHANFGKGNIGIETIRAIRKKFKKIPFIIETSYPDIYNDIKLI